MGSNKIKEVWQWGWFSFCRILSGYAVTTLTSVRHINVPSKEQLEGCMLAGNHQSYLDPVLIGMALDRPINYLARSQLFKAPGFGRLIRSLGAHPVRQGEADRGALRTVMRLLRQNEPILFFPEGTRTFDGELGVFQPGVASLAVRCKAKVIPVCVEGAFNCWPRNQIFPGMARAAVMYGEPVSADNYDKKELIEIIKGDILKMQKYLRCIIGR